MSHFFSLLSSSQGAEVFFKSSCVKRRVGCNFQLWRSVPWTSAVVTSAGATKKTLLFSIESWLVAWDPYKSFLRIPIWGFPKIGYPQIIPFNKVFHYKPSILGYPFFFWKHPYNYYSIIPPYKYNPTNQVCFFCFFFVAQRGFFLKGCPWTTSGSPYKPKVAVAKTGYFWVGRGGSGPPIATVFSDQIQMV